MPDNASFAAVFFCSLLLALLFAIYPLPYSVSPYRPEWICLLVIYWALYTPHHIGVGTAWLVGLLQDVMEGAVWGGHAFALALVTYVCLMSYRRLRSYSLTQQLVWVFVLVGLHQMFVNWFQGLDGYDGKPTHMVLSALVTAACWPLLVICMRSLQRRYRIF